jgi:hypothetical protein
MNGAVGRKTNHRPDVCEFGDTQHHNAKFGLFRDPKSTAL